MMTATISPLCWQSLQLGLPTPFQALSQLFLSVDIQAQGLHSPNYTSAGCQELEPLASLTPTFLHRTLPSGTNGNPSLVPLVQEELLHPWNFLAYASQSFKLHSATAPLGLAWLLAVLKLWWATAWDLVLIGKLWLGRLLETLASGVSSKSHN